MPTHQKPGPPARTGCRRIHPSREPEGSHDYDLVFALADMLLPEWSTASEHLRQQRYQDHCQVNAIIAETVDTVQDSVVEQHVPWFNLLDEVLGPLDEMLVSRLISHWRDEV